MKQKANKYKIELKGGAIHLDRKEMIVILSQRRVNFVFGIKDSEDSGMSLFFPPKGLQRYTDEVLIQEVQKSFNDPMKIKELLSKQKIGLRIVYSQLAKKDKELLKLLKKEWAKAGTYWR